MDHYIQQSLQNFLVIGVSYKTAPVEIRERFALSDEDQQNILQEAARNGIAALIPLSTCNRTEIYAYTDKAEYVAYLLRRYSEASLEDLTAYSYIYKGHRAINHLFYVACGLDSQILGELEITGQLKQACRNAYKYDMINSITDRLLQNVFKASKRIKTETDLSSGSASVSRAAVQYIRGHTGSESSHNILLYGLGEIGQQTCTGLLSYLDSNRVTVINRTYERSRDYARQYGCHYDKEDNLHYHVNRSDIVIVATGANHPTLTYQHFEDQQGRDRIVLDLSIPRNVCSSVAQLQAVRVVAIDDLQEQNQEVLKKRQENIPLAKQIIAEQSGELYRWIGTKSLSPVFSGIQEFLASVKQEELYQHRDKLSDHQVEHMEEITGNIINKISRQCIHYLKNNNTQLNTPSRVVESMFQNPNKH